MSTPLLSIIIPIYKKEPYLSACIDSILAQTFQDWELILVDDGSPDKSPEICDNYAATDNRIKVIHQENGGVSRARNQGVLHSTGKYISFVDADDDIDPDTYEGNILFLEHHPEVDVVQFPARRIGWGDQFYHEPDKYYKGTKELILNNYMDYPIDNTVCMKIFRRQLFEKVHFREGHVHEDKMFVLEMLKHIDILYISGIGHYNYHRRDNSILTTDSYNKTSDWIDTEIATLKCIYEYPETKHDWIRRWMYNIRWLMNLRLNHPGWNVVPLLYLLNEIKPRFSIHAAIKDLFWLLYIKLFGIKIFHNNYLKLLQKHNKGIKN